MNYKNLITLNEHKGAVYALCQTNETHQILSAGSDRHVILWDIQELVPKKVIAKSPSPVVSLMVLSELNYLLIGQMEGGVHIIDLARSTEFKYLKAHKGYIFDIQFISSKNEVVFASGDGSVSIWSLPDFKFIEQKQIAEKKCRKMSYSPERGELAISSGDGEIHIYDVNNWKIKSKIEEIESSVNVVAHHANQTDLMVGAKDAHLLRYNIETHRRLKDLPAHYWAIYDLVFSPEGDFFATASRDKTLKIWDAKTDDVIQRLEGLKDKAHTHSVNALLWLDYKNYLVSAGDDRSLKIWENKV